MTATPPHPRQDLDRADAPAWYDTAASPTAAPGRAWAPVGADDPTTRHRAVTDPPAGATTSASTSRTRRTVSARVTAAIGVVAFLVGAGLAMLTGPLLGPGGPGGPGGAPGTSQQTGTSSSTTGT